MKILIYGSLNPYALESFYIKHLNELGHEVIVFPGSTLFRDFYQTSFLNKIMFRLGVSSIYKNINYRFFEEAQKQKPDCLLVFKGMELYPATIKQIKEMGIYTVSYNPDHPFVFHGRGTGNKNVIKAIPFYDLHISYSLKIKEAMEQIYHVTCDWLPFGFELTNIDLPEKNEEIKRVCFIGTPDKQRASTIKRLLNSGIFVDVYSDLWHQFLKPSEYLQVYPAVYNEAFNQTAVKYRIQLNLFRPHNNDSHNMRTFEMPRIGCIILAPDSREHQMFFENQKESFFYTSPDEMIELSKYILNLPFDECVAIRKKAIERSEKSGYSYLDRTRQLINIILQAQQKETV